MTYCTDVDLLHWEPNLMVDAGAVAQTLISGTGSLTGTAFTIAAGSLADAHVQADHVIVLRAPVAGSYPVVSVEGATGLTLSVLYDRLYPAAGQQRAPTPPLGSSAPVENVSYSVKTFWPQRRVVSEFLERAAGIEPGSAQTLANPDELRRACVLGSLQMIYAGLSAGAAEPAGPLLRAELYERMYRRALRAAIVEIDLNGDGQTIVARPVGVLELKR